MDGGGANWLMESCVDFARMPLSFSLIHKSYEETGDSSLLFNSTALSNPLPWIYFTIRGNYSWIFISWFLNSCPNIVALKENEVQLYCHIYVKSLIAVLESRKNHPVTNIFTWMSGKILSIQRMKPHKKHCQSIGLTIRKQHDLNGESATVKSY